MKVPLAAVCALFIAGIAAGTRWSPPSPSLLLVLAATGGLFCIAFRYHLTRTAALSLAFAWIVLGILAAADVTRQPDLPDMAPLFACAEGPADRGHCTVEGYVIDSPRASGMKTRFTLGATALLDGEGDTRRPVRGSVSVTLRDSPDDIRYGDYLRLTGRLRIPRNFRNPGGFDYEKHCARRGIFLTMSVNRPIDSMILRRNAGSPPANRIEILRDAIRANIDRAAGTPERELLGALILGEKHRIPPAVREWFIGTGVAHVLAISGFHIGMAALFSTLLIRAILSAWTPLLLHVNLLKASIILSLPAVVGYALVAGFAISTRRAALMISIFALSLLISRTNTPLNTLSLAAVMILVVTPASLFDISFQLSFTAVAAIVMVLSRVYPLPPGLDDRWFLKSVIIFFVVTIAAALATAPIIALSFNRLPPVTLLSNALTVPVIGFAVLPLAMAATFLSPLFPALSAALFTLAAAVLKPLCAVLQRLSDLPWSSLGLSTPAPVSVACFYASLVLLLKLADSLRSRKQGKPPPVRRIALLALCLALVAGTGLAAGRYLDRTAVPAGRLEMICLDVGQGSAALVTFPDRTVMLVDGGGFFDPSFDTGKNIVAPYLRHRRIRTIDVVVLTHPDQDHIGGLPYILETFRVGEVWTNGDPVETATYRRFIDAIEGRGIPHRILWSGSPDRSFGGALVSVVSPREPCRKDLMTLPGYDVNRYSLVLQATWGDTAFLLTGDITGEKERTLLALDLPLKSRVMQVPHHGSHLSSLPEFLDAVEADIAVVSSGFENRFRFPRPEVVDRYRRAGTALYRTDRSGAVTVSSDGTDLQVSCFIPCEPLPGRP